MCRNVTFSDPSIGLCFQGTRGGGGFWHRRDFGIEARCQCGYRDVRRDEKEVLREDTFDDK